MSFKLNKDKSLGLKKGVEYWQTNSGIIFSDYIDQSNLVGGGHEEGRNTLENPVRLERVASLIAPFGLVLDFGCGHGMLVQFLKNNNVVAFGYDKFNPEFPNNFLPETFNLITCIECVEHLHEPFDEIDLMFSLLKKGGKVMLESSFTDWLPFEAEYIDPEAGHHCVWSHAGLTEMMLSKGFVEGQHINQNVRIYIKP